jgi:hypothetical protein
VRSRIALVMLLTALVAANCGSDDTDEPAPPGADQTSTTAASTATSADDGY